MQTVVLGLGDHMSRRRGEKKNTSTFKRSLNQIGDLHYIGKNYVISSIIIFCLMHWSLKLLNFVKYAII